MPIKLKSIPVTRQPMGTCTCTYLSYRPRPRYTRLIFFAMAREEQVVGPDALVTAVSWTGGKDCNLAGGLLKSSTRPTLNLLPHPPCVRTSKSCFDLGSSVFST